jgi:hypothetical protein
MRTAIALLFVLTVFGLPMERAISTADHQHIPAAARKLIACYPDFLAGYAANNLLFKDGSKLLWDDSITRKTYQQLLDDADLKDMFAQPYTVGTAPSPAKNFDPGRIRNEAFFKKMYGLTKTAVEKNLVQITWCPKIVGQKIMVTKVNGVLSVIASENKRGNRTRLDFSPCDCHATLAMTVFLPLNYVKLLTKTQLKKYKLLPLGLVS